MPRRVRLVIMEDAAGTVKNKSMRKSQKKQIENMLDLLDQAHTALKKAVETGNTEIALTVLEQAQDSAIQVGGMIEESLGEEFATVRILESYCEQVYQSYEMIRQQQAVNIGKVYKSLRRELIRMENSVKNDIPIRTSVVFLPYKASMWDSLGEEQKQVYKRKAEAAKKEYLKALAAYKDNQECQEQFLDVSFLKN